MIGERKFVCALCSPGIWLGFVHLICLIVREPYVENYGIVAFGLSDLPVSVFQ
jgi:hypothetical protein